MKTKFIFILLIAIGTACQSGLIPCPKIKADKTRRSSSFAKKIRPSYKSTTASAKEISPSTSPRTVRTTNWRTPETRPALEHVDVEEWDCPKPGSKRSIPKALKENIRKNKKAYESYYRHRSDSSQSIRNLNGEK